MDGQDREGGRALVPAVVQEHQRPLDGVPAGPLDDVVGLLAVEVVGPDGDPAAAQGADLGRPVPPEAVVPRPDGRELGEEGVQEPPGLGLRQVPAVFDLGLGPE